MNDTPFRSALCMGLSTSGTMLFVGAFHIPHPYIALVFATTLAFMPRPSAKQLLNQIFALTLGCICAVLLLVMFPEEPWFFVPFLGLIASIGYAIFLKHSGPGAAAAFSFYFLAIHITCISQSFSPSMMTTTLEYWLQAFIAIVVSFSAALITKFPNQSSSTKILPLSNIIMIGVAASIAGFIDASIEADQSARLILSSISTVTALQITYSSYQLLCKLGGYLFGIVASFAFIIIVASSGNDFGVYLLALALSFGFLQWLACRVTKVALFFQSVAMMLSFCILMLPTPDVDLHVPYRRSIATFVGFLIAILVFLVGREMTRMLRSFEQRNQKI